MDIQKIKEELEKSLYSQTFESTQGNIKEKRDKLAQEYHQKGIYRSSPHARAVVELELEGLKTILDSYLNILKRVYFDNKNPDEKFLRAKIEELYHVINRASKQSLLDYLSRLGSGERYMGDFESRATDILSQVLRDVRISTLNASLKPKKESSMTTKEMRDQFLIKLNEMSEGDIHKFIESMNIGDTLGFYRATTFKCVRYFRLKGFIEFRDDAGGTISITAEGIDEADKIQSGKAAPPSDQSDSVFIVHGHDEKAKLLVERYIGKLGLKAIILHEMPNKGRAVIEKFEEYSKVGFAVVLLTPDDWGASKGKKEKLKPRARQNVIFELGYFVGKLSRERVCVLRKGKVENPSDYEGIVYVKMDKDGAWEHKLVKEMNAAGIKIDSAKLLI